MNEFVQYLWLPCPALPDDNDSPARSLKVRDVTSIAGLIVPKLLVPEILARLRRIGKHAAVMTVPEATVHKNDCSESRQYDVWAAALYLLIQTETESCPMKSRSNKELWLGVTVSDL